MAEKRAHSIEELAEAGPFGRTTLYEAIRDGDLVARKFGRKTVVLDEDWDRFLKNLPVANTSNRYRTPRRSAV